MLVSSLGRRAVGRQPWPRRDRPAAGLRGQPQRLHRDLRPAGEGRCAAHPGGRRHRQLASWSGRGPPTWPRGWRRSPGWLRPPLSTTPTPTSARTCRTPSESTRRVCRRPPPCATPTSSAAERDQMMSRLASTPDGILVSLETITDYSLHPGDLLRLRVLDQSTGRFRIAPFHVVGTVQEFPSAPRDSFMVTNLGYLNGLTHSGPNVVFAKTQPESAGRRLPHRRGHSPAGHRGQEHRPADRPDGHLDHDRRSHRDQPSRGGLRDPAGRGRDVACSCSARWPSGVMSSRR